MQLISLIDRVKNSVKNKNKNLFFLHIPKTGGTSINEAFLSKYKSLLPRSTYSIDSEASYNAAKVLYEDRNKTVRDRDIQKIRQHLLMIEMLRETKYISGHIAYEENIWENSKNNYQYVTILRNPIKRFISHYLYNKTKDGDYMGINDDLAQFIHSPRGKSLGSIYIKFIGGLSEHEDYRSGKSIEKAQENLHRFNIVGFLEYLELFTSKIETSTYLKLNIPHKRKTSVQIPTLSEDILKKIEEICEPDIELYNYAIKSFT